MRLEHVSILLASLAILLSGLVYAGGLRGDRDIQAARKERVEEQAFADLVICARGNYQDARDKLQDQLLLDLVSVPPDAIEKRRVLFRAAARQLGRRLAEEPPDLDELITRWRGDLPVGRAGARRTRSRERGAMGSVARAEARDRGDRPTPSTDCSRLPSQRPFSP